MLQLVPLLWRRLEFASVACIARRTESLQTTLIAVAFWTLAVIALTNLRYVHLWGLPQVEVLTARATMVSCALLLGLVGARCVMAWRESGSLAPIQRTLGGTPGMLLFAAVASYLAIGVSVLGVEAIREPDMIGLLKYEVLLLGVLVATAGGGRAVLERIGADRLLQSVLVVLIVSCAIILVSPALRDSGFLSSYRIPYRLTGAFSNPNDAGLAACMTVVFAAALLTNGGPRTLSWLGLAAGIAAVLVTASRTALVILGAMAVVFLLLNVRGKLRTIALGLAAVGLSSFAVFVGIAEFSGGFSEWLRLRSPSYAVHEVDLFCDPSPTDAPGADCAVLLATRDILAGDVALNWNRLVPVNRWQGVTVDGPEGHVTRLALMGLGLNGRVPSDLGRLDRLVHLSLPRNRLTGRIPPELGNLASLEQLNLNYNTLTGAIPPELAKLKNLKGLRLRENRLTGPVPAALGYLDLAVLRLSGNDFDSIPPELTAVDDHDLANALPCTPLPPTSPMLFDDCTVLLAVKETLAGEAELNWHADIPIGSWDGVSGSPGRVTGLDLEAKGLTGRIPPELDRLDGLVTLNLSANRLTGRIPPELGNLASLERLNLNYNTLTGAIPPELGRLSQLVSLNLSRNRLTGPVPPELGELTNLEHLAFPFNALSGPIPPELGKLSHLRELSLWNNRLSGPVPAELEGLEKLILLRLSGNDLQRPYPRRLFGIANSDFVLDDPRRRRSLGDAETAEAADRTNRDRPDAVRRLFCRSSSGIASELQADCALLLASRGILAGDAPLNWSEDIPIEFWQGVTVGGAPKRVTALELPRAGLNGRLFAELGELGGLVALNLSHNRLAGPIPPGLGRLEHLISLRLEGNRLTGPVPQELEGLDNLFFLRLAGNDLNRPFPPALHEIVDHDPDMPVFCRPRKIGPGLLTDCALLLTVRDSLAGDAPLNWREEVPVDDWLGVVMDRSRGRVTALDLTQMGLNGRIPAELGQLAGLVSLRLGRNRLAGDIPPELGNLVDLRVLALDGNLLAGSVPPELGKLSKLTDLWLRGNRLIGPTPSSVAALPKLAVLRLDDDDAAGERPAQDYGRSGVLDRSLFCQSLPEALSRLNDDCATLLDARDVLAGDVELNWSDAIPIGYWRGVTVGLPAIAGEAAEGLRVIALDLSHMGLNGRIPAALSALDALAVLRLGHNRLAGSIPPELGALSGLRTLSLENNALTGTIPEELGAWQGLFLLRLGTKELTGLMRQFTTLTNLRVLALENTGLQGNVNLQLGNLSHLEELRLENNRLHGEIPKELDSLTRLTVLRLGGNAFAACVPATARAAQVRHNDLESADLLCGSSPWGKPGLFDDGAHLMRLRDILAGDAALNWSYARPVASWQGVTIGQGGRVVALDLRDMNLTGRIPAELSELSHLQVLRLDGNRLTGAIPPELGNLTRLTMLSLDGNRLTGLIPPELANLSNLGQLWLADNRLTGSVPPALAGITGLSLGVAGNGFHGCMEWDMHRLRSHDIRDSPICAALAVDRLALWKTGFEKAVEAPVFGHGFGALAYLDGTPSGANDKPLDSHNLYLMLLGEAGIVPPLLFVSAIVLLLRAQWAAPKSLARDATVAGVIVIALYCMTFQHLLGVDAFIFLAGLSVATGAARNGDRHLAKA